MPIIMNPGKELREIFTSPAFRYGEGFFSTTRIINYIPLWLEDHIKRLENSVADFSMGELDEAELIAAARKWPRENHIENGFMRMTCWAQEGDLRLFLDGGELSHKQEKLAGLTLAPHRRHSSEPLLGYKSFNYWPNNITYRHAVQNGYYDAVFLNEKGEISETSRCNIFWSSAGKLYTPEAGSGLLPGICRDKIIYLASRQGTELIQGRFPLSCLEDAEEVFLTNSVRGIVSISHFENQHFYKHGPLTAKLAQAYKNIIEEYFAE